MKSMHGYLDKIRNYNEIGEGENISIWLKWSSGIYVILIRNVGASCKHCLGLQQ